VEAKKTQTADVWVETKLDNKDHRLSKRQSSQDITNVPDNPKSKREKGKIRSTDSEKKDIVDAIFENIDVQMGR